MHVMFGVFHLPISLFEHGMSGITLESTDDDNVYTIVQSISAAKLRCGIP